MAAIQSKIVPNLWFDHHAEEAARFYTGIFPNSSIGTITRYSEVGQEIHGRPPGSVLTITFTLEGLTFVAINGGPLFHFTEAVSFQVLCDTQAEVDHYWEKLSAGGDVNAQQCGWLKDSYGLSWQVVPRVLMEMMSNPDSGKTESVMGALLQMKKLDIAGLQRAYDQA